MKSLLIAGTLVALVISGSTLAAPKSKPKPKPKPPAKNAKGGNAKLGKIVLDKHFDAMCGACHKFGDKGNAALGGDLTKIGKKRNEAYIYKALKTPQAVNPKSVMPPVKLPDKDLKNLAAYLAAQK